MTKVVLKKETIHQINKSIKLNKTNNNANLVSKRGYKRAVKFNNGCKSRQA